MGTIAFGAVGILMVVYLFLIIFAVALVVLTYVFNGIGFSEIARRRSIDKPWLAWVPGGNLWILGSISDQYRYVAQGQVTNRRKILLWLCIASYATLPLVYVFSFFTGFFGALSDGEAGILMLFQVLTTGVELLSLAISVPLTIFTQMALYDLYRSCEPSKSMLYLMLSIFVGASPFCVFFSRKKDEGMPPRKEVEDPPFITE